MNRSARHNFCVAPFDLCIKKVLDLILVSRINQYVATITSGKIEG